MLVRKLAEVETQVWCLRLVIVFGLLVGMTISWKLWYTADRLFPVIPLSGFPRIPAWLEIVILGALTISLIVSLFKKYSRAATGLTMAMLLLLAAGD